MNGIRKWVSLKNKVFSITFKVIICQIFFNHSSKKGSFFRKGKVGDWLNYFDRENSIALDEAIAKNLNYKRQFDYGLSREDLEKIYSVKSKEKN